VGPPGCVLSVHAPGLGRLPVLEAMYQRADGLYECLYLHLKPLQALLSHCPAGRIVP